MGKLGISVYPERSTYEKDAAYLELAHKYGFKRVFTSLLEIRGDKEEVISSFKKVVDKANDLGFEVMIDINPALFEQLGVSYDDLRFFKDLGADGVRLDLGFTGAEEAKMTRNPYGLKVEINMSSGTNYVDNIMSYSPDTSHLYGSHNFYPMRYSGLGLGFFNECTVKFTKYNLNTMAFVNSQDATFGPWPFNDGLVSLEIARDLPLETQTKLYQMLGGIDDITIANAYASENELRAMSEAFFAPAPVLKVVPSKNITENERVCLFESDHSYRGDRSDYILRSTMTRVWYKEKDFPAHDTDTIRRGDVLIGNVNFGQYKGETQIALQEMPNAGQINVVGHIAEEEMILLNYLKPWSAFKMREA
jgi:hypothetical protein